jgi:hypothetical protein
MSGRDDFKETWDDNSCDGNLASDLIGLLSQLIFTVECAVKVLAEGYNPVQFFTDAQNGRLGRQPPPLERAREHVSCFAGHDLFRVASHAVKILCLFVFSWNCLDAFVVFMGFIEMSPLSFIFNAFPVVLLRLLRLLRVFRLAKALPRLRSIVEALISGFSAVGEFW